MILAAEIGLTMIGLLTIVKGRWRLGQHQLEGSAAFVLGGLCFITIPLVYFVTAVLHEGNLSRPGEFLRSILAFHLGESDLNGLLIEFVVLLLWATGIILLSSCLNWFAGEPEAISEPAVVPQTVFEIQPVDLPPVRVPKIVTSTLIRTNETSITWEKRNLPLSDSVDSEATLL